MRVIVIIFLVLIAWYVLWPRVRSWLGRKAQEKAEDYLRQSMGLPPRPGSKRERRERRQYSRSQSDYSRRAGDSAVRRQPIYTASIIKVYAEDVEYEEFYEEITLRGNIRKIKWITPGQLVDVKWEEIRR